jgi:hypothetical protein
VEVCIYNISTKRSSNYASFDKISKSGDGGHSGGILDTLTILNPSENVIMVEINSHLIMKVKEILKLN